MNPNYSYPKNENEFFSRQYSVDQLVKNYTFQQLMFFYHYGMNTLNVLNHIIENNLFDEVEELPHNVENDKMYFVLRTAIIRNAMQKMDTCQIFSHSNFICVHHLN
jgi:hypothetical protein